MRASRLQRLRYHFSRRGRGKQTLPLLQPSQRARQAWIQALLTGLLVVAVPQAGIRPQLPGAKFSPVQTIPRGTDPSGSINEGQRPDPLHFSAAELEDLQRHFGVHGAQPRLAQLFTEGIDQLVPLRSHTLQELEDLKGVILSESKRHRINPMLVTAVLFDELQHAKPGENTRLAAESGLFQTHGPAQLSLGELQKQGLLSENPTPDQITAGRRLLLDPDSNVQVLVGQFARLSHSLGLPRHRALEASGNPFDAKALATLAYLHNGKLDYPGRILRYMQNPELHALLFGNRRTTTSPLI
jgi:hypothetical protein